MRFILGLVIGILLGMWLQAHDYTLRLPFERRAAEAQGVAPERDAPARGRRAPAAEPLI